MTPADAGRGIDTRYRRFVMLFGGCAVLLAGLAGGLNRVVDPFWYFRDVEIPGLNAIKTKVQRFERYVKPVLVARDQPQALIFGSSFAEVGFDPLNAAFTDNGSLAGYNFGVAGAPWYDVQCYFEYALRATTIKRAVIGIAAGPLPAPDCGREMPDVGRAPDLALLFSLSALKASLETMLEQKRERPSHSAAGLYYYTRGEPGTDRRFREYLRFRFRNEPACAGANHSAASAPDGDAAALGKGSPIDLQGLERIIRLAVAKGVELRIVAYPQHALGLELDFLCGTARAKWQALARIADLVERAGGAGVQLWEFYGYNGVLAEPVDPVRTRYWQDAGHFNYELGNLMLDEMFGSSRADRGAEPPLGRQLTPSNVAASWRSLLRERAAFLQRNPGFRSDLDEILGLDSGTGR